MTNLTPWQRELSSIATVLRDRIAAGTTSKPSSRTLWWGGGYSELLATCGNSNEKDTIIADIDHRRLRKNKTLAGEQARMIRLLALSNLRADTSGVESVLKQMTLRDIDSYLAFDDKLQHRFENDPAVPADWADRVVMDFILNRIDAEDETSMLAEAFRVMAPEGGLFCATLVSDEPTESSQNVKSAPLGMALRLPTEMETLRAFERAGFHGIQLHWSAAENPAAVDRIADADVRMCIIEAYKGKQGPCLELGQAVIYCGPWSEVRDDDGHIYRRGERVAVCAKTYGLLMRAPYQSSLAGLRSVNEPPIEKAMSFDCNTPMRRDPKITKGLAPFEGSQASACASGSECC